MIKQTRVRFILFLGVLGVTSSAFIIRGANQPSYILAGTRVLITGLISYLVLNQDYDLNLSANHLITIFIAGLSLATHFGWWFDSLNYLPVGTSLSLTNTAPVWMAIFVWLYFGVTIKNRQKLAIIFVILGSAILFWANSNQSSDIYGLILAIGSAIGFAIYLIAAREMVPVLGLWRYFGLVNIVAAIILFIWSAFLEQLHAVTEPRLWLFGLALAIFPGLMGHAIYNWTIPKLDTIDVGIATLGEPILGTIIAWIFLSEVLKTLQLVAITCLIIAISFTIDSEDTELESAINGGIKGNI